MSVDIASKATGCYSPRVFTVAVYFFFCALLLQNTVALSMTVAGLGVPVHIIYLVKDFLLVFMLGLMLVTKTVYKFSKVDRGGLILMFFLFVVVIVKGGGIYDQAMQLRFYLTPLVLYFLGRNLALFSQPSVMIRFIFTISSIYVFLGLMYVFVDRETLLHLGLGQLLSEKLGHIGREGAIFGGLPINFYFYHKSGEMTNRAFGALFDPLASAFMGAVLFFYLIEIRRLTRNKLAGFLAAGVAFIIVLTITRAIIIGILISLMVFQFQKKSLNRSAVFVLIVSLIFAALMLTVNFDSIFYALDPSTRAHFSAYLNVNTATIFTGEPYGAGQVRGAESLYLTLLKEHGLVLLLFYLAWLQIIYGFLRKHYNYPFAYATVAAMLVYMMASLTTEHWFSFSSGALFWFLLGTNLTAIQAATQNRKRMRFYVKC